MEAGRDDRMRLPQSMLESVKDRRFRYPSLQRGDAKSESVRTLRRSSGCAKVDKDRDAAVDDRSSIKVSTIVRSISLPTHVLSSLNPYQNPKFNCCD